MECDSEQGCDDGGEIWGRAAAPGWMCWELLGTGRLPGQRQTARELSVQGAVVVLWHPAPVGAIPVRMENAGDAEIRRDGEFFWSCGVVGQDGFSLFPFTR